MHAVFVMGDVHGHFDPLMMLLRASRLVDESDRWAGGDAVLWFTGDFCDRGPRGIDVIRLVIRLQRESRDAGGEVGALLGNHEIMLLGAYAFPTYKASFGSTYYDVWRMNGGRESDRTGLENHEVDWLMALPALAQVGKSLMMHCDSTFYLKYGKSVKETNDAVTAILRSNDPESWDDLMETYFDRGVFAQGTAGVRAARDVLQTYGPSVLIHGHTPIPYLTGEKATTVVGPAIYAEGLCIDVDGGLYMGGPGFILSIDPDGGPQASSHRDERNIGSSRDRP